MDTVDNRLLEQFLDWYDPEARHRDIGLSGVVGSFMAEKDLHPLDYSSPEIQHNNYCDGQHREYPCNTNGLPQ